MIRVVLESPYAAPTPEGIDTHVRYARRCVRDCLLRGEAPIASHLLFTQHGILDDAKPHERALGMQAGFAWNKLAEKVVVYTDHGISKGMHAGIAIAKKHGIPVEMRTLDEKPRPHPDVVAARLQQKYKIEIDEDELVARVNGQDDRLRELIDLFDALEKSEALPDLPAWLLKKNATESSSK